VRTVMSEMGKAMMGTGEAEGERRAVEAAEKAISNPLLDEVSLRGAKAVIINITGGDDLGLMEVEEAAQHIREMVDPEANIIVGSAFNDDLNGRMRVSVVATGIESSASALPAAAGRPAAVSVFGARPAPIAAAPAATPAVTPAEAGAAAESAPAEEAGTDLRPAAVVAPLAEELADDDSGLSDADLLELGEPLPEETPPAAELPLPEPVRVAAPPRAPARPSPSPVAAPERRLTLFERMMHLSRKPKEEQGPTETLAPEPEAEIDEETRIPPFMRRQRN